MWDEVETHLLGKNVFLETSFTSAFLPPERLARMIQAHGSQNVCFGTDWPWNDPAAERAHFANIGLTDDDVANIQYRTALRMLGEGESGTWDTGIGSWESDSTPQTQVPRH